MPITSPKARALETTFLNKTVHLFYHDLPDKDVKSRMGVTDYVNFVLFTYWDLCKIKGMSW